MRKEKILMLQQLLDLSCVLSLQDLRFFTVAAINKVRCIYLTNTLIFLHQTIIPHQLIISWAMISNASAFSLIHCKILLKPFVDLYSIHCESKIIKGNLHVYHWIRGKKFDERIFFNLRRPHCIC